MLKKLNTIKDAVSLSKSAQVDVNGGRISFSNLCATTCPTAASGTYCLDGGPHCPAECDGRGGWHNW